jgi:hypothetical protein
VFKFNLTPGRNCRQEKYERVQHGHQNRFERTQGWNRTQQLLPGDCQNVIVLSDELNLEILNHPIPTDLEAAKA